MPLVEFAAGVVPVAAFDGIVHYRGPESYASRRGLIFRSRDDGRTWRPYARLPLTLPQRAGSAGQLAQRLWRATVHHVVPLTGGALVVFGYRRIYRLDAAGHCGGAAALRGSRPLCVSVERDTVYYGEYRANREGSPVHIWASRDGGATWISVHRFAGVRHVHGVFADPHEEALWVTTGDSNAASGIWRTRDRFATLDRVAGGNQQTRAVQLLFTRTHVYFGSDAPRDVNHLYRLRRKDGTIERLQRVEGPVYYGCQAAGRLFFSTACEPPTLRETRDVAVWSSADGERWERVAVFRKDRWPARILQHGHVLFPAGTGGPEANGVWLTPVATGGDQRGLKLGLPRAAPNPEATSGDSD